MAWVASCPLTPRQLKAFGLVAQGHTNDEIAELTGSTAKAVRDLHFQGFKRLGVHNLKDALRKLADDGWLSEYDCADLPPAAFRYLQAFDAYLQAPPHERDQMLVRDLCNDALDELLAGVEPDPGE